MASINDIINKGAGDDSVLGLSTAKQAIKKLTSIRGLLCFKKGVSLQEDTYEAVRALQKAEKLKVIQNINTTEQVGDDDNIETLDDGTQQLTNKGKHAFMHTTTNGVDFNVAMQTMNGFDRWTVAWILSNGDLVGVRDSDNSFNGSRTGMFQTQKLGIATTTEGQKEYIRYQFLDRNEQDADIAIIKRANLDWNPLKLEDVVQCNISYVNVPQDGDTTITVKVTALDLVTPISGLDYSFFNRTVAGATVTPTAGDDSASEGVYVLTVPSVSTNDVEQISLFDSAGNSSVIEDQNGDLFKSNTATATATA